MSQSDSNARRTRGRSSKKNPSQNVKWEGRHYSVGGCCSLPPMFMSLVLFSLTKEELQLFLAIWSHNPDPRPSLERLAQLCNCKPRAVSRNMGRLVKSGLVAKIPGANGKGGLSTNQYQVIDVNDPREVEAVSRRLNSLCPLVKAKMEEAQRKQEPSSTETEQRLPEAEYIGWDNEPNEETDMEQNSSESTPNDEIEPDEMSLDDTTPLPSMTPASVTDDITALSPTTHKEYKREEQESMKNKNRTSLEGSVSDAVLKTTSSYDPNTTPRALLHAKIEDSANITMTLGHLEYGADPNTRMYIQEMRYILSEYGEVKGENLSRALLHLHQGKYSKFELLQLIHYCKQRATHSLGGYVYKKIMDPDRTRSFIEGFDPFDKNHELVMEDLVSTLTELGLKEGGFMHLRQRLFNHLNQIHQISESLPHEFIDEYLDEFLATNGNVGPGLIFIFLSGCFEDKLKQMVNYERIKKRSTFNDQRKF